MSAMDFCIRSDLGATNRRHPVPGILRFCNYLQNVGATTCILGLQLSTFIFYNKHSLRHDMKNHLIILYGYAAKNETDHICAYINRIADDLSLTNTVDSGSHIVSALIAEKEKIAKSQNIRCDINISTPDINIDDFSITTIIGNLFDNAIKAAAECEHGWIRFSITQTGSYMNIVIENSYFGNIIENNGEFTST